MRTFFCWIFICAVSFGSTAVANICDVIGSIDRIENRITTVPSTYVENTLSRLRRDAVLLSEFYPPDAGLRAAVDAYTGVVIPLLSDTSLSPARRKLQLATPQSRRLLQQMLTASFSQCGRQSYAMLNNPQGARPSDTSAPSGMAAFAAWSFQTPIMLTLAAILAVGLAVIVAIRFSRRQELQNQRFMCNIPVTVKLDQVTFATRFHDISAKGAKIKLPEFPVASGEAVVTVNGKPLKAKLTWQNGHFGGLQFRHPLPLSKVHSLAQQGFKRKKVAKPRPT